MLRLFIFIELLGTGMPVPYMNIFLFFRNQIEQSTTI
jgi:hypothetical protein